MKKTRQSTVKKTKIRHNLLRFGSQFDKNYNIILLECQDFKNQTFLSERKVPLNPP